MAENNKIPKHWQVKKLGEVCNKISLNGIKIKQKDYLSEGKFPVVDQGQDIIGGYFDDEKMVIPDEPPYVIFGDHTRVKKFINFKFIAGADGVKVLKPHPIYDPKFFFYLIHTVNIPDKGYARHFQFLEKEEVPLPPLPEQQAIVSKIEELFSELDNGIAQLKTTQQQLKVYRQSLLKWAFEGKLTSSELGLVGLKDDKIIEKDNKKEILKSTNPKNLNSDKGELPKGWKWVKLGEVCNKIGDIDHKMPKQLTNGYPYVSTKDFTNDLKISFDNAKYISKEDYLNLSRKIKPERGDIIFPRYGTIGKNILIDFDKDFLVSYSCAVIKPNSNLVLSKYVYLFSLSPKTTEEIRKYVVETTQTNVGIASIKNFEFPLPSLEEQQLIVSELESKLTVCDKIEETISQSLQQAETLRQSILKKAFSGELVKNHGNPKIK